MKPFYHQSEESKQYVENCIIDAWNLYELVLCSHFPLDRQRWLLDQPLWGISEEGPTGNKYRIRYVTRAAREYLEVNPKRITGVRRGIIHEHVYPRKDIREELCKVCREGDRLTFERILHMKVVACVVTREEDRRLSALGKGVSGWERYVKAGIEVWDGKTGIPLDFSLAEAA